MGPCVALSGTCTDTHHAAPLGAGAALRTRTRAARPPRQQRTSPGRHRALPAATTAPARGQSTAAADRGRPHPECGSAEHAVGTSERIDHSYRPDCPHFLVPALATLARIISGVHPRRFVRVRTFCAPLQQPLLKLLLSEPARANIKSNQIGSAHADTRALTPGSEQGA